MFIDDTMLEKELINKICGLGLTQKQAKIYVAIATCKSCSVKQISERSEVHPQDIYKILPILENYGLVTRTIGKPIKVEVVPLETALNNWFNIQEQKLKSQKEQVQEIIEAIKIKQELSQNTLEHKLMILHEGTKSLENMVELVFKNAQKKYDAIFPEPLFIRALPSFQSGIFNILAEHGAKAKILVRKTTHTDEDLIKMITSTGLNRDNFTVKATRKNEQSYYAIVDDNEVWVVLKFNKPKTSLVSVLVTNNEAMVIPYKNDFQTLWMDPETTVLLK